MGISVHTFKSLLHVVSVIQNRRHPEKLLFKFVSVINKLRSSENRKARDKPMYLWSVNVTQEARICNGKKTFQ